MNPARRRKGRRCALDAQDRRQDLVRPDGTPLRRSPCQPSAINPYRDPPSFRLHPGERGDLGSACRWADAIAPGGDAEHRLRGPGRQRLPITGEEKLCGEDAGQPNPSPQPPGRPMPQHVARANAGKSAMRPAVEHVVAHQKRVHAEPSLGTGRPNGSAQPWASIAKNATSAAIAKRPRRRSRQDKNPQIQEWITCLDARIDVCRCDGLVV